MSRLLTEQDISRDYGIALGTLRGWRYRGGGPAFFKLGRRVAYSSTDVEAWLASCRRGSAPPGIAPRPDESNRAPETEAIARKVFDAIDPRGDWETNRAPLAAVVRECGTDAVEEATADVVAMIRRRERFRRGPLAHLIDEARRIAARREAETRMNDGSG